jgi:hypothetical protein
MVQLAGAASVIGVGPIRKIFRLRRALLQYAVDRNCGPASRNSRKLLKRTLPYRAMSRHDRPIATGIQIRRIA